jgi:pilus assembly protein Flp/PilA
MSKLAAAVRRFVRDEEGATMAEYALLVGAIALVAIVGIRTFGNSLNTRFSSMAGNITNGQ